MDSCIFRRRKIPEKQNALIRKYEKDAEIVKKFAKKTNLQARIWREIVDRFISSIGRRELLLKVDLWNEVVDTDRNLFKTYKKIGFKKIIFVEFSKKLCILYSRKKVNNRDFIVNCDLTHLPLKDKLVDVIMDISTSDHLSFKEFNVAAKEYSRVLKDNGLLILLHNNSDYYLADLIKKSNLLTIPFHSRTDKTIERVLTKHFNIREKRFIFNLILDPIFTGTFLRIIASFLPKEFIYLTMRLNDKRLSPQVAYICQKIPNFS